MNTEMIKAQKEMSAALTEMARTEPYPELYAAAKARHIEAKRKMIELYNAK
jgi:hypothetical protein